MPDFSCWIKCRLNITPFQLKLLREKKNSTEKSTTTNSQTEQKHDYINCILQKCASFRYSYYNLLYCRLFHALFFHCSVVFIRMLILFTKNIQQLAYSDQRKIQRATI